MDETDKASHSLMTGMSLEYMTYIWLKSNMASPALEIQRDFHIRQYAIPLDFIRTSRVILICSHLIHMVAVSYTRLLIKYFAIMNEV